MPDGHSPSWLGYRGRNAIAILHMSPICRPKTEKTGATKNEMTPLSFSYSITVADY